MKNNYFPLETYYDENFADGVIDISCSGIEPYSFYELQSLIGSELVSDIYSPIEYAESFGVHALRSQLAEKYNVCESCVLITNGASESITIALMATSNNGGNVIVGMPFYNPLKMLLKTIGLRPQYINTYENYVFTYSNIMNAINKNTCAILLNNPNNPIGAIIDKKILSLLINKLNETGAKIIVDEVGLWLTYRNKNYNSIIALDGNMIAIGSLSKAFGVPGIRIGWLITTDMDIMSKAIEIKRTLSCSTSIFAQSIASKILYDSENILMHHNNIISKNIVALKKYLSTSEFIRCSLPSAGATCFPTFKHDINAKKLAHKMLSSHNYLMVPGEILGIDNGFRLGLGFRNTDLIKFFNAIEYEIKTFAS